MGEIIGREKNGICACISKYKGEVLVLTNKHSNEMVAVLGDKMKPKAVIEYNGAKCFIDISN